MSAEGRKKLDRSKILVVDDEKSIRELFVHALTHYLPEVRADVVANGAEAVEAFQDVHYAVLLMDIHMPKLDGQLAFEKIMDLCAKENIEEPSIVFCTGYEPPGGLAKKITSNPAHCILRKPVKNEDLVEAIRSRLAAE